MCVKELEEGRGCAVFAGVSRSDWVFHSWLCWVEVVRGGKWAALVTEEVVLAAEALSVLPCTYCSLHSYNMQLLPLLGDELQSPVAPSQCTNGP